MSKDKKRREEKERLMREVLGKPRGISSHGALSAEVKELERRSSQAISDFIKLSEATPVMETSYDQIDTVQLQSEIERDFGVSFDTEVSHDIASLAPHFSNMAQRLQQCVIGQDHAIHEYQIALFRSFVRREAISSIYIHSPAGRGKRHLVQQSVEAMAGEQLLDNDHLAVLDMSHYRSAAQQQVFVQDLYDRLYGRSKMIMVENYEQAYSGFQPMMRDLILKGTVSLEKRYAEKDGILTESSQNLRKDHVSTLEGHQKILVFISTHPPKKLMDVYGKAVYEKMVDQIALDDMTDHLPEMIQQQLGQLTERAKQYLSTEISIDSSVPSYLETRYDSSQGIHSFASILDRMYLWLEQLVLEEKEIGAVQISVKEGQLSGLIHGVEYPIEQWDSNAEMKAVNVELEEIIGLEPVKEFVENLGHLSQLNVLRRKQGLRAGAVSKHMIFTGNSGTGKTTIARLISRYLKAMGILRQGQLVEVSRADLVGKYVGHTAPLTMSVIESALGGVLFVDEAYSLYRGSNDSFGLEAIDTLVKGMEDHRDDVIVILAGYEKEMKEFLSSNSGLRSRFSNHIHFPDYTAEELLAIAHLIAKKKDYEIDDAATSDLLAYFAAQQSSEVISGNGRVARNMIESAIIEQSKRLMSEKKIVPEDVHILRREDFKL